MHTCGYLHAWRVAVGLGRCKTWHSVRLVPAMTPGLAAVLVSRTHDPLSISLPERGRVRVSIRQLIRQRTGIGSAMRCVYCWRWQQQQGQQGCGMASNCTGVHVPASLCIHAWACHAWHFGLCMAGQDRSITVGMGSQGHARSSDGRLR